ncbi:hypothetical protein [Halobacillus sp. A5]|nr:hypothetical protein [Halobacillus sp. A5]MCP3029094.1 hypothetical protein [Halobacillus sp. A5]
MKSKKAKRSTAPLIVKRDKSEPTVIDSASIKRRVGYKSGGCCGKRR